MAGQDLSGAIDTAQARDDLRAAMMIGLPDDETLRPTFHFPSDDTYTKHSRSGQPWDFHDAPNANQPDRQPVQVPCAYELHGAARADYGPVGEINTTRIDLTLVDVDWETVRGFHIVTINGDDYRYSKMLPTYAIYDLTVYQVEVVAGDVH